MVTTSRWPDLVRRIKAKEGFVPTCYEDAGGWSIGYGYHLTGRSLPPAWMEAATHGHVSLTETGATILLQADLLSLGREVVARWPWMQALDETRKVAIMDMAYNLGVPRLTLFRRMLAALRDGDWETAATEARASRWYQQVGRRAVEVVHMIRTGEELK
jgi:lysozyme